MRKLIVFLTLLTIFVYALLSQDKLHLTFGNQIEPIVTPTIVKLNTAKLFTLINQWRLSQGYKPYIQDERLCRIAIDRSDDEFEHETFMKKYDNANYPYVMQENLSLVRFWTDVTEEKVLKGWLNSPPHRTTLEKPYTHSCVACDKQCVQIFSIFLTN